MFTSRFAKAASALLMTAALCGEASAQSLAGQVGDKRYPVRFPNSKDQCAVAYRKYVAHGGHAAYAQNSISFGAEAFFCSIAAGRTKEAAEKTAIANCSALGKRYKMRTMGRCQVYASK